MVNSLAPNTEPCGTPDVTAFVKGSPSNTNVVVSLFNVRLEPLKGSTGDPIHIL